MMSLESEQQDYEERLRYRLKILSEQLKADKVKIASHLAEGFEESFRNIKYDESGDIILESVDGRIRSMALAIEHFDTRAKLKKEISLVEIQKLYFDLIEHNFDFIYKQMLKANSTPNHIAEFLSTKADFVDNMFEQIPDFMDAILSFWKEVGDIGYWHL